MLDFVGYQNGNSCQQRAQVYLNAMTITGIWRTKKKIFLLRLTSSQPSANMALMAFSTKLEPEGEKKNIKIILILAKKLF